MKYDFSLVLKDRRALDDVTLAGKLLIVRAEAMGNVRSLTVSE